MTRIIFILTLILSTFLSGCTSRAVLNYETVFVPSDSSFTWKRGCFKGEGENGSFITYLPPQSTCEHHGEMLTIQFNNFGLPPTRASLSAYFSKRQNYGSNKECYNFKIILEDEKNIMWVQSPKKCSDRQKSYSISKLLLGKDGIHMVEYSNRDSNLTDKKMKLWENNIKNTYVEKNGQSVY